MTAHRPGPRGRRRSAAVLLAACALVLVPTGTAQAHPLGNFTVNHHDALLLTPDGVSLTAVVDRAEIPTAQALPDIAADGDPSPRELDAAAARECAALAGDVTLTVDGDEVAWTGAGATMEVVPGAAGLPTLRSTCELTADVRLDRAATVVFRDDHLTGQLGWREITADGDGVRLLDSPVPTRSITDELRSYPEDLLASPLDVRALEVRTEPGDGPGGAAPVTGTGDPFGSAMAALDRQLQSLVGDRGLTPLLGVTAVLLAVLLGCAHALLPRHGKTVMAAYLAGRRGRPRDALTVGATVTVTHTVGVLVLGLAVSLSTALAGDQTLRWLGVASGVLVAFIGAFMLRDALRTRNRVTAGVVEVLAHVPSPAVPALAASGTSAARAGVVHADRPHEREHHHPHDHGHDHDHDHGHGPRVAWLLLAPVAVLLLVAPPALGSFTAARQNQQLVAEAPVAAGPRADDPGEDRQTLPLTA